MQWQRAGEEAEERRTDRVETLTDRNVGGDGKPALKWTLFFNGVQCLGNVVAWSLKDM